jgi:hypothetical protein
MEENVLLDSKDNAAVAEGKLDLYNLLGFFTTSHFRFFIHKIIYILFFVKTNPINLEMHEDSRKNFHVNFGILDGRACSLVPWQMGI